MSLSTSYQTRIIIPEPQLRDIEANVKGVPCMELLQIAVDKIAREHNGRVLDHYLDCNGRKLDCQLAVATRVWPRGLGIQIADDGLVRFEYDAQGVDERVAESLCDDLTRAYATAAVLRIQSRCGYEVSVVKEASTSAGRKVKTRGVGR